MVLAPFSHYYEPILRPNSSATAGALLKIALLKPKSAALPNSLSKSLSIWQKNVSYLPINNDILSVTAHAEM